jgi:hypothetical protein
MTTLTDPGRDLRGSAQTQARLTEWRRPATRTEREARRADRVAAARARMPREDRSDVEPVHRLPR